MQITSIFILIAFCSLGLIQAEENDKEHVEIIILGAGVAGLTAAKTLSENNVTDFLILEGSDRIGGRVKHGTIDSNVVELGCTYIVGMDGNPVWDLAKKYNLSGIVTNYEHVLIVDDQGNDVTHDKGDKAWEKWDEVVKELNKTFSHIEANKVDDMSVRVGMKMAGWFPDTPVKRAIEYFENADFTFLQTADLLSLKSQQSYPRQLKTNGNDSEYLVSDKDGFVRIFNEMKNEFLTSNDTRLKLNEIVECIKYTESKVTVTTKDNKTYTADYAIMTFGLGVLQNRLVKFEPQLPTWKEDSLFRINVGHSANIMVKCPTGATHFLTEEYALYASQNYGFLPIWVNMMTDGLLPTSSNIISSMPIGEEAKRVERIELSTLKSEIGKFLRDVNKNQALSEPDILVSDWSKNPLFMGSSSSLPVGFTDDQMENMKAPVGRLYFAGDAYHDVYNGHMQGAYYSGRDQAKQILECRKKPCKKYEPPRRIDSDCSPPSSVQMQILPSMLMVTACAITSYIHL